MRQNDLSLNRWYAETISAKVENTRNSQLFAFIEVASEYAKRIFAHIENTSEEKKVHGKYTKSSLFYSPYTLIDINLSLSWQFFY